MHPFKFHGGRLDDAARAFAAAPVPWLDLSTGVNPFAWGAPGGVAADLRGLPSPAALAGLEQAAAASFGARHSAIAALPGSEIGLRLLAHIGLPAPYRHVSPSYRTHAEALPGSTAIDVAEVEAASAYGGTLLIANPNNPDGRLIPPERLLAVARRMAGSGGVLVVDEAFADAMPGASVLPHLGEDDAVLVFRSFGKFFGLAGVRLGFACGAPALVSRLAALLGSWPVSSTAITLGTAAYRDTAWIAGTQTRLAEAADTLDRVLRAHGLASVGACPLFRLIEVEQAERLFDRLAQSGILTRPFDHAPSWLRIGLPGDAAALARLDAALGGALLHR